MKKIICLFVVAVLVIAGSVGYAADNGINAEGIVAESEAGISAEVNNGAEAGNEIESLPSSVPTAVLTDEGKDLENLNNAEIPQSSSPVEDSTKAENDMQNVEIITEKGEGLDTVSVPQSQKEDKIDNNAVSQQYDALNPLIFDIGEGDVIIEDGIVGETIKVTYGDNQILDNINIEEVITVTGTSISNAIKIYTSSGTLSLIIKDLNIQLPSDDQIAESKSPAIGIFGNANVNIIIEGTNNIRSAYGYGGIHKENKDTSNLTITSINGEGKMDGELTARGGYYGAGIGGGKNQDGANISIKGGTINAIGHVNGAGIGGGTQVMGTILLLMVEG